MRAHLAICGHGYLGLITSDTKVATPYSGDYQDLAWVGIHMAAVRGKQIGDRWRSKNPKILCHLSDSRAAAMIQRFNSHEAWGTYPGDLFRVRSHDSNERLVIVQSFDGDRYEWEYGKWTPMAGTARA